MLGSEQKINVNVIFFKHVITASLNDETSVWIRF